MKSLLILTLATGFVACSQSQPAQTADAIQNPASTPAPPEAQSPPPAAEAPTASTATTGQVPAPDGQQSAPRPSNSPPAATPTAAVASAPPAAPPSLPAPTSTSPAPPPLPAPVEPPAPKFREVTIPAGTSLSVTVLSNLASNTSKVEDPVRGSLAKPVIIGETTAIPAGAELRGVVTDATGSGRVKTIK